MSLRVHVYKETFSILVIQYHRTYDFSNRKSFRGHEQLHNHIFIK